MTKRQIFDEEEDNYSRIILHREGVFWKAYNHSAFMLCSQVREYKIATNFYNSIQFDALFSVGFPCNSEAMHLKGLSILSRSFDRLELQSPSSITEYEYNKWKPVKFLTR